MDGLNSGRKLIGMVGQNGSTIVHAMILVGIENNEYVFKNSYGYGNTTNPLQKEYVRVPVAAPAFTLRNVLLLIHYSFDLFYIPIFK